MKTRHRGRDPSRAVGLFAAAAVAAALCVACQTRSGDKAARLFLPLADNKNQVLATVTVRGLNGTVATLAQISKDLGLPFSAVDLHAMVVARSGLPQPLVEKLDLSAPIGLAVVHVAAGQPPVSAAAVQARSADEAKSWLAALGQRVRDERGATAVRTPDGAEYWIFRDGKLLVGSVSFEGLRAAGAHAIAGRTFKTAEDFHARLHPAAFAARDGKDLRTSLTLLRAEAMAEVRRARLPLPVEAVDPLFGALLDAVLDPLVDAQSVDVALAVDAQVGVRLLSRLWPKPQTALARNLAVVKPYALDPSLRTVPLPAGLFAINYSAEVLSRYQRALRDLAQATTPGLREMAAGLQSLLAALTSAQSGTFGFADGPEHTIIAPLRSGAQPGQVMAALENVLGPQGLGTVVNETHRRAVAQQTPGAAPPPAPAVKWQRQPTMGRLDIALPQPEVSRPEAALLGAFSGQQLAYTVAVAEGRLMMTSSPRGEAHLAPLMSTGARPEADSELDQVLRETAGREGFIYADVFRLLRPALATAARHDRSLAQANAVLSFIPGVDRLRMPVIASYVGGTHLHAEVLLPYRTLRNVSNVLRPLLGMGLGGILAPGAPGL